MHDLIFQIVRVIPYIAIFGIFMTVIWMLPVTAEIRDFCRDVTKQEGRLKEYELEVASGVNYTNSDFTRIECEILSRIQRAEFDSFVTDKLIVQAKSIHRRYHLRIKRIIYPLFILTIFSFICLDTVFS